MHLDRCRRPECRLPIRKWTDYGRLLGRPVQSWLYRWLRGTISDAELATGLRLLLPAKVVRQYLAKWPTIRDGLDLPEPITVELWQWPDGLVLLSAADRRQVHHLPDYPSGSFIATAERFGELYTARQARAEMPLGARLIACWSEDGGARLAADAHPGQHACQYLGLPWPARWLTTREAAAALGKSSSRVARLANTGVIPSRRSGPDYEIDPLYVTWRVGR